MWHKNPLLAKFGYTKYGISRLLRLASFDKSSAWYCFVEILQSCGQKNSCYVSEVVPTFFLKADKNKSVSVCYCYQFEGRHESTQIWSKKVTDQGWFFSLGCDCPLVAHTRIGRAISSALDLFLGYCLLVWFELFFFAQHDRMWSKSTKWCRSAVCWADRAKMLAL
jgi:hypothetical protein